MTTPLPAGSLSGLTVAFDLDGTLVDTAPDLVRILNLLLAQEGFPPLPIAQARLFVGQGARVLLGKGAEAAGATFSSEKLNALTTQFLETYGANVLVDSVAFSGLEPALIALQGAGATLCVCTNKLTRHSVALLDAMGLSRYFASNIGADSPPQKKPDARHLIMAVEQAGGDMARAVMIGDTSVDGNTAKNAGVPFIFCAFGYEEKVPEGLSPIATLKGGFEDLPATILRLSQAGLLNIVQDSAASRTKGL